MIPEKSFKERESVLTELFRLAHIRTIYNVFIAILIGLCVNNAVREYFEGQNVKMGLNFVYTTFNKLHIVLLVWGTMFVSTLTLFKDYAIWTTKRRIINKSSPTLLTVWDGIFLILLVAYYAFLVCIATVSVISFGLKPASSAIVVTEMIRMIMKVHAFVRTNAPKSASYTPNFKSYLYFMFAPTLIYRDEYPRTPTISWKYACRCFGEVLLVIYFACLVFESNIASVFKDYGKTSPTTKQVVMAFLESATAGCMLLLCAFYCILHAWMNGFAEILRFGDRMFYQDWWIRASYGQFFPTWNVVIYDWLHQYVYKEVYDNILPHNRKVAKIAVFFVSAAAHEYILTVTLGFFFPLLFVLFFGLGQLFTNFKITNWLLWYTISLGTGIVVVGYAMEYHARLNCAQSGNNGIIDYFLPRVLTCDYANNRTSQIVVYKLNSY